MKKDHRGLSLIEIVIVVAIMAILAGSVGIGVGMVLRKPADECASKLQSALQSNRMTAMGKVDARLEIYIEDGYIYIREIITSEVTPGHLDTQKTETRIGDRGVELYYVLSNNRTTPIHLSEGNPLILSFNRSNGGFNDLADMDSSLANVYCEKIYINKGNRTQVLTLTRLTGKVSVALGTLPSEE